jgi:ribose-phosphate pyrophosphokinase
MSPLIYALPGNEALGAALAEHLPAQSGTLAIRQFPDEETYLRVEQPVSGRDVVIAATLDRPNRKLVDLYLLACTLRSGGARRVVLVAPYLPYLRQDRAFHDGESLSAEHVGRWLSSFVDGIVTVDPHLHRIPSLADIHRIPTEVVHAAPAIGRWVRENVARPLVIGPDEESAQWVIEVAHTAGCRHLISKKLRHSDRDVSVTLPGVQAFQEHTPVLVDDIVSSAATMIAAVHHLRAIGQVAPVCIAVHGIFADDAYERLHHAGAERIVSCNTVSHRSNAIDVHREVAIATGELLASLSAPVSRLARAAS